MNDKSFQVAINGIGLVSALGNTLNEFFHGLVECKDVQGNILIFDKNKFEDPVGAPIDSDHFSSDPEKRILEIGGTAIKNALKDWGRSLSDYKKIALVVGSGLGLIDELYYTHDSIDRNYLSSLGDKLLDCTNIKGTAIYVGNACSASSQAVSYGTELLTYGCYDIVIAGGIDIISQTAYAGFMRLNAIDNSKCKPFDKNRRGIMVGEGAAFFVLEKKYNTDSVFIHNNAYCYVIGCGITNDAYHIVQMKDDGVGIERAMEQAVQQSQLPKSKIDLIIAHGTGTPLNDRIEADVIHRYLENNLDKTCVMSPKGAIGHTGGASGAMGMLVAIGAFTYGLVPPVLNLTEVDSMCDIPIVHKQPQSHRVDVAMVNTFAFGGTNVVILLKRIEKGFVYE
ncbi:beta-ketoacyl-[acyl-carrier-protein] synthase family protein [Lutispora saccharofermentans]|uniref:Beta-ketoacyl-[acyl-carrier-protein] synthase family protein n=1 Tax=Lutispora saccharofermentans TaxID=3024236 RepID=A0ABT1NLX1_9FIRM|nr:beta-ketoacyl-[acyl-carrier-protein] synthase family protein [Lutispora saccharofermentans]MCQ1531123.1 beta-ketoacyl-[acyl-carrier-protein] synthase family protein [Lutispora saccharofermentans]